MSVVTAAMMLLQSGAASSTLLSGLLGYWKLDGNSTDALGLNNGSDTGVSYVTGKINQGATTSGGSWVVNLGTSTTIKPRVKFTVAAWMKWNAFASNVRPASDWHQSGGLDHWILGYENAGGGDVQFVTCTYPDGLSPVTNLAPMATGLAGNVLATGTWYHLVGTYDGSILRAYRNGALITTVDTHATVSPTLTTGAGYNIRLGSQAEAGGSMNGIIDEFAMWDRDLSAAEVTELYNAGTGKQYPFT